MVAGGIGVTLCSDSAEPRLDGSDSRPGEEGGLTIVSSPHVALQCQTCMQGP